MKKWIYFLSLVVFMLVLAGCNSKDEESKTVKVIAPAGGPTLAIVDLIANLSELDGYKIEYEVIDDPQELNNKIRTKSHEIVIAPTNAGANLYNKGSNYIYAGAVTNGNLYLVGTENVSVSELANKEIIAFGNGAVPGITLEAILKYKQIYQAQNIEYVAAVNDAQAKLISGNYKFALLAEPALSVAKIQMANKCPEGQTCNLHIILDLQSAYQEMTGLSGYPQAGIFINQDFVNKHHDFVQSFLEKVAESTALVNQDPSKAADLYLEGFNRQIIPNNPPKPALIGAVAGSNIAFIPALESKPLMEAYLHMILDSNPNLVGGKLPDDDFYLNLD